VLAVVADEWIPCVHVSWTQADGDFDEGRVAMLVEAIAGDINKMAIMDVRNRVDHVRDRCT